MPRGHYDHPTRTPDITGQTFNDWTVIERGKPRGAAGRMWLCRCTCGTEREVRGDFLRSGRSKGCGCRREQRRIASQTRHGMCETSEYGTWKAIWQRCTNPTSTKWDLYGGRGIRVDDRWLTFEAFYADMGPKPSPRHSIERRDGDLGYSPENCYWATLTEQNRNTSRNRMLTFDGRTASMAEWAEKVGLPYRTLSSRIYADWPVREALTVPYGKRRSSL